MSPKHSPSYMWGVLCGMAVAIILFVIIKRLVLKQGKRAGQEYDERQQLIIGRAYKYAFYTLAFYNCAAALFEMATGIVWCELMTNLFIGIIVSVMVFAVYCIRYDAYMPLRVNPVRYIVLFSLLGVFNIGISLINSADDGSFLVNGMLTNDFVNLLAGAVLLLLALTLGVRCLSDRNKTETDRE